MSFLDNLFNNNDYTRLGITADQVKELDLLDGKEDKKLNGKSIFEELNNYYNGYSKTDKKLDFVSYVKSQISKNISFNIGGAFFDNTPYDKIADELIEEIFKVGKADLDKPIKKIKPSNVVDVLQNYKYKSDEKNTYFGKKIDNESLFEAILDEATISNDKKKEYINHIKNSLIKRVEQEGGNAEYIGKIFGEIIDKILENKWPLQDATELDIIFFEFTNIIEHLYTMNKVNSVEKNSRLEVALKNLYNYAREQGLNTSDLFGNGKLDNNAKQMTGNCVLHAEINAMLVTDKGRQYLNNLVVKDTSYNGTGNITVYLPGAKKNGVPKENPGYFTYTTRELANRILETSIGDGDLTAIVCAIEDCKKQISGNNNSTSVESTSDISTNEILFIQDKKHINFNKSDFQDFKKLFEEQNHAITSNVLSGQVVKGYRDGAEYTLLDQHAYAVINVLEDKVLLKESNDPNSIIEVSSEEFKKMLTFRIDLRAQYGNVETAQEVRPYRYGESL